MTELCQYWRICKCYERETYICHNAEAQRETHCTAYMDIKRNLDLSSYNKTTKTKSLLDRIFGRKIE